jgi:hypothetical protein
MDKGPLPCLVSEVVVAPEIAEGHQAPLPAPPKATARSEHSLTGLVSALQEALLACGPATKNSLQKLLPGPRCLGFLPRHIQLVAQTLSYPCVICLFSDYPHEDLCV